MNFTLLNDMLQDFDDVEGLVNFANAIFSESLITSAVLVLNNEPENELAQQTLVNAYIDPYRAMPTDALNMALQLDDHNGAILRGLANELTNEDKQSIIKYFSTSTPTTLKTNEQLQVHLLEGLVSFTLLSDRIKVVNESNRSDS